MTNNEKRNIYNAIQNLYNMDFKTWQEVLAMLYNLVADVEQKFEKLEAKFTLLVGKEVTEAIKKMHESGELAEIINQEIFSDLNNKIDEIKTSILNALSRIDSADKEIEKVNEQMDNIVTIIKNVSDIQNEINSSQGNVKFLKQDYILKDKLNLKGNTTYDGNNCILHLTKTKNITIPQNEQNIIIKNFNFVGDLKFTKVVELLDGGKRIKCESNVFSVGDNLGASIYGVSDKPYTTITGFDGTYYTLDASLSENGNILNSEFGNIVGTFSWSSLISGGKNNDNIIIENCTFTNSFGYSLTLPNTKDIRIENCKFLNNGLDFLLFSAEDRNVSNITIKKSYFEKSIDFGKQCVVCTSKGYILEDIVIEQNEFISISESALSFGYAEGHIKNISIRNNRFKNNYLYDIHVCGYGIDINNNIFEDNRQCSIRIGDVSSVIYPNTALLDSISIKNNTINGKNGIVISPMKTVNGTILYPWHCDIDFNTLRTEYIGVEYGGNGLNVRNNFIKCDKNNGAPNYASTILINNIHDVKSEFINIKENNFDGQIELKWLDSRIINIENNVFNKALLNKMVRIQDMSSSKLTDTKVKIKNNVFYKSPLMSLQTGSIAQKTEYSLNTLIDGETISLIPYMKGRECYYNGTVNNWKFSHDNNNAITKDNYFESNGKFIYIASDGTIKVTNDVTNIS